VIITYNISIIKINVRSNTGFMFDSRKLDTSLKTSYKLPNHPSCHYKQLKIKRMYKFHGLVIVSLLDPLISVIVKK